MKRILLLTTSPTLIAEITAHPSPYQIQHATSPKPLHLPDLILAELSFCKRIKRLPSLRHVPLIIINPPTTESDVLFAFALGADDYLHTPLSLPILFSRIQAFLKARPVTHKPIPCGPFQLDPNSQMLLSSSTTINLTAAEYSILHKLLSHPNKPLSRHDLLTSSITPRNIDVHIASLRKKLGKDRIKTIRGLGYQLTPN